ncbi:aldehyde dehydrogenase family protein [Nocardia sp. NPDC051756]|uniref:aldehyde dehydrogenase family protein n=1 Tax=Nocardia sp. NPDC051756 TaxID=3154751 RepID=UPI0034428879
MLHLDALGPTGPYRSRKQEIIHDRTGNPVATLSLVPRLYVTRAMQAMHQTSAVPVDERIAAIARAGHAFATERVAGQTADEYQRTVSAVAGMPITVVRQATEGIERAAAHAYRNVHNARPVGAVGEWQDPSTRAGRAVWTRRGEVFAVHAAGNHPAVHQGWLEPLALGYRVAVRPSRREPFTPHRLISALRTAGFGEDQVMLLPTDHDAADEILRLADLGMVYGGDTVVAKYAGNPAILPQGPGRSKILLTEDADWTSALDTIVESISGGGGVGCVNATAILVEGDPTPIAAAVADRLAALPSLPAHDEQAILPVHTLQAAHQWEDHLLKRAAGTKPWLGGTGIVHDLGNGTAALRPAVHQVDSPLAPQITAELPFPCVWIAPWTRTDALTPLRNTLVLAALTPDRNLIDELINEPTISNVYLGNHPTTWLDPALPHDSYLGEFLMRTKSVLR